MRSFGMEVIAFPDVMCQMCDLLKPARDGRLTLADFLHPDRVKLTGALFSAMFNLSKFQAFEARDPVVVKQELNLQGTSQWDRYAQAEYARLASEEEEAAAATAAAQATAAAIAATAGGMQGQQGLVQGQAFGAQAAAAGAGVQAGVGTGQQPSLTGHSAFHLDDDEDDGPMTVNTLGMGVGAMGFNGR